MLWDCPRTLRHLNERNSVPAPSGGGADADVHATLASAKRRWPVRDRRGLRGTSGDEDNDATSRYLPNKFPKGLRVRLADELEPGIRVFDVKKP